MKKSKLFGIVILLLLVIIGLVGFIVYDKCFAKSSNGSTTTASTTYNYSLSKRKTTQAVCGEDVEAIVDMNGDVYLRTITINPKLKKLEAGFKVYTPKGYENLGGDDFKGAKLNISKVLSAYYVHLGNGGFTYFVFVAEDGKLAYLSYDDIISDGKIDVKVIDSVKNVVAVVENTYTMTPYAIDMNGNEISLYEYLK